MSWFRKALSWVFIVIAIIAIILSCFYAIGWIMASEELAAGSVLGSIAGSIGFGSLTWGEAAIAFGVIAVVAGTIGFLIHPATAKKTFDKFTGAFSDGVSAIVGVVRGGVKPIVDGAVSLLVPLLIAGGIGLLIINSIRSSPKSQASEIIVKTSPELQASESIESGDQL